MNVEVVRKDNIILKVNNETQISTPRNSKTSVKTSAGSTNFQDSNVENKHLSSHKK